MGRTVQIYPPPVSSAPFLVATFDDVGTLISTQTAGTWAEAEAWTGRASPNGQGRAPVGATDTADLLTGVREIAAFLGWTKHAAQHRIDGGLLPHFHVGRTICARRSTLNAWLAEADITSMAAREAEHGQRR